MHCLCIDLILQHYIFFFFNDTATTEIYTLSLHDALPIFTSTQSGLSCLRVARFRPPNKILAVSPEVSTVRMLAMVWGVNAVHGEQRGGIEERYDEAVRAAREASLFKEGEPGHPPGRSFYPLPGSTNKTGRRSRRE